MIQEGTKLDNEKGNFHCQDGCFLTESKLEIKPLEMDLVYILLVQFRLLTLSKCRFLDTVQACALDVDVSQMVGGDMAYIGEKGANISGGQRARVALARQFQASALLVF